MEMLKLLTETPGISGREEEIREVVKKKMKPLTSELRVDRMGNVIGLKKGKGKLKVMISAHMDEIGFIVKHVDEQGFVRLNPVGGFDPKVLIARRVIVSSSGGTTKKKLRGIIGCKPVHTMSEADRKRPTELNDLFVDVGLSGKEAKKLITIGDPVTFDTDFHIMAGDCVSGKCLDDRLGVYVMLKALEAVKKHDVDIYAVSSVQEEVGLRGATVSSFGVEPDIGIALDVTLASDLPGSTPSDYITELGKGTAIKIMDSASISNYKLVDFMKKTAEKSRIKYQLEILPRGGTDAGAIERSRAGVPVITISVPIRYVHSGYELASRKDIQASVNLLARFLETAHLAELNF